MCIRDRGYTYEVTEDGKKKKLPANDISEVQIMSKLPALWVNNSILPRVEVTDRAQELITCEEAGLTMGYPDTGFKEKAEVIKDIYENEDKYSYAIMDTEANLAAATEEETDRMTEIKADFDTYYQAVSYTHLHAVRRHRTGTEYLDNQRQRAVFRRTWPLQYYKNKEKPAGSHFRRAGYHYRYLAL